jgi:hypothetical protein
MADSDFSPTPNRDDAGYAASSAAGSSPSRRGGSRSLPFFVGAAILLAVLLAGLYFILVRGPVQMAEGGYGLMQRMAQDVGSTLGLEGKVRERTVLVFHPSKERSAWLASEENFLVRHLFEDTFMGSTKQLEIEAAARAGMGFEFGEEWVIHLDPDTRRARITPPAPELLFLELSGFRTLRDQSGVWNWLTPEDRDEALNRLQAVAREQLNLPELSERAEASLRRTLERTFAPAGIAVEWQPAAPVFPTSAPAAP